MKLLKSYIFYLIFIVLTVLSIWIMTLSIKPIGKDEYIEVTVSQGDTIWAIADKYSHHHSLTKDEFIQWVEEVNQIDVHEIFPGDKIIIPIKREDKHHLNIYATNY
jgi:cell division protein YceG involved in septum cleavage